MAGEKPFGLPASVRLKKRKDVVRVLKQGKKVRQGPLECYFLRGESDGFRFGVQARSKLGIAVLRNRAKRLVREVVRLNKDQVPAGCDFFILVSKWEKAWGFEEMKAHLLPLFDQVRTMATAQ